MLPMAGLSKVSLSGILLPVSTIMFSNAIPNVFIASTKNCIANSLLMFSSNCVTLPSASTSTFPLSPLPDRFILFSSIFIMKLEENKMNLSGKGDRGKVEVEAEGNVTQLEENIKSEFAIQFLVEAIKTFGMAFENIIVETGNNMPLRLTLESPAMGSIQYVQAHKELS